ncbi:MAG: short-chain dehydrogenase [Bacteroidetes bacterium]|nr:MAG: short-chain dehydrogenase [Bacteroidota bacterium]
MDLEIKDKLFIVCGATSGLGKGVADALLKDGAKVIAVARDNKKLNDLSNEFPGQVEELKGDITQPDTIQQLFKKLGNRYLNGILVNAGGPPAKSFLETELTDWDDAYLKILKWKVNLTKIFLPIFQKQKYGRFVFIESESVKQPIRNLVLSTSLRSAVLGFVKTLSQEVSGTGITLNILAPGFHDTPAAQRLFVKRAEIEGISVEDAKRSYESEIPVNRMGDTSEFGMLGAWLLSPHSGYITGQTITVDGGSVKGMFG